LEVEQLFLHICLTSMEYTGTDIMIWLFDAKPKVCSISSQSTFCARVNIEWNTWFRANDQVELWFIFIATKFFFDLNGWAVSLFLKKVIYSTWNIFITQTMPSLSGTLIAWKFLISSTAHHNSRPWWKHKIMPNYSLINSYRTGFLSVGAWTRKDHQ
jgi:hypothetical protein